MLKLFKVLFTVILCLTGYVNAQDSPPERYLDVKGHSEIELEPLPRATINLYEGSNKIQTIQSNANGDFSFRLAANKQYDIEVEKSGLISKRITFNTSMPDEEKGTWINEFSIGLVKPCEGVDYSVLKDPVDMVAFDPKRREFLSDKEYVAKMRTRIENMMIKTDQCMMQKYESALKTGDRLAEQNKYEEAVLAYKEALSVYPTEEYPSKQINALNNQMIKQKNTSEQYKNTINEADALAAKQNYNEALQKYKSAAGMNAQDNYPRQKISEIETALAKQEAEKQAQQNAEDKYNLAMARASVAYTKKDFEAAKQYYQEALNIKPSESLPKTRVQEIETFLAVKAAENNARAVEAAKIAAAENEYKALITKADELYSAKQYDEAKQTYTKALSLKSSDPYPAQRVKTIENTVTAQQAAQMKARNDGYELAVTTANKALAKNQYTLAKESFQKALSFRPDDTYAKDKLTETDMLAESYARQMAEEEQAAKQYKEVITSADELLQMKELLKAKDTYNQALSLKPGDSYALSKITTIDNTIAADQAARTKATEESYKAAIGAANTAIAQKSFKQAVDWLQKAVTIKPGDVYATNKLTEVNGMIDEQQKEREQAQITDNQYKEVISVADQLFNERDYSNAREAYAKAVRIKAGDTYATQRISAIDAIFATEKIEKQKEIEATYSSAMTSGTSALIKKDYNTAKTAFQEALKIKPNDASAYTKLAETESLIVQEQARTSAEQDRTKKYDEYIVAADQLMKQGSYSDAKTKYEQALTMMPGQSYPRQKLDEIAKVVTEQERLASQKQANELAYSQAITNADRFGKAKDYDQARDEYNRALVFKPDESYPKDKAAEMVNLILIRQQEKNEATAKSEAYTIAMNNGNTLFAKKDYDAAKNSYNEALKNKPNDLLASEQIRKADNLIAGLEKQKQAEEARKKTYTDLIASADNSFDAGSFTEAKENYKKALIYEPGSVYAKQRISRIDEITKALAQSRTPGSTGTTGSAATTKVIAAIPMGELSFKTESERQKYLEELKNKYPAGVTLEIYRGKSKETMRYIVIREEKAQEFRQIQFMSYNGFEYSVNGKPITQQYFLSQVKSRPGENYKEIELQ
jgi:tetratricopeptide (TPR) repeat protein